MLTRTKGHVVVGGKVDAPRKKIDVTVVRDVQGDDSLLEDEIFGPVLAVVPVDVSFSRRRRIQSHRYWRCDIFQNLDDALEFVADRPESLAVYLFSSNDSVKQYGKASALSAFDRKWCFSAVRENTISGALILNDTFFQLASTQKYPSWSRTITDGFSQYHSYLWEVSAPPGVSSIPIVHK